MAPWTNAVACSDVSPAAFLQRELPCGAQTLHTRKKKKILQFVYYLGPYRPQPLSGLRKNLECWLSLLSVILETCNNLGWREKLHSWIKSS